MTPENIESDDYDDHIVDQFARDRSRYGSMVISGEIDDADSIPEALMAAGEERKGMTTICGKYMTPIPMTTAFRRGSRFT